MTRAVLLAVGWPETDAAGSLARELAAQLAVAGAPDVRVLARPGVAATLRGAGLDVVDSADPSTDLLTIADLATGSDEAVLLCAGDLVAHGSLLWHLATDPAGRTGALVGSAGGPGVAVHEERGRVVATADGPGTGSFLGALYVAPPDLPALATAARRAAAREPARVANLDPARVANLDPARVENLDPARIAGRPGGPATGAPADAIDLLLVALLASGVTPTALRVRLLHAERVTADRLPAARAALAAVDEEAARLRLAVKEHDDFFTTYFVSSFSPRVTRWAARLRLTPTGVTGLSVLLAVLAALAFWQASRPLLVAGAVLLYLGFVLDCVDGQLARYTRQFSPVGGWLDTMADRAKEFVVYAGLAAGAERTGLTGAWRLAVAAILLQTVRHLTDAWYGALHDRAALRSAPVAGSAAGAGGTGGLGERLGRASTRVQAGTGSAAYWLKRVVVLPIGERWALLAVVAALFDGRTALLALLGWGLLAAAYTLSLRSLRARAMRVAVLSTVDTARHRDDGPLVRLLLGRLRPRRPGPLVLAAFGAAGAAALLAAAVDGRLPAAATTPTVLLATAVVLLAGLPARAPHTGPLDWLVPAALRAAEYLFLVGLAVLYEVPLPLVFAVLFTLAMRHYDVTARMEKVAPTTRRRPEPGWDGRVVLFAGAAVAGLVPLGWLLVAGYVVAVFLADAVAAATGPEHTGSPEPARG